MAYHTLKLIQSGSTLYDFQDTTKNVLSSWGRAPYSDYAKWIEDVLIINPTGSSVTTFYDNLQTLYRTLLTAKDNFTQWQRGAAYTPIFLQFQHVANNDIMQTEVFGGDTGAIENYMTGALRAKIIPNLKLTIRHRPYMEEQTQTLYSGNLNNQGGSVNITSVRGDVPSPLYIKVRTATTHQDRIIVGVKARGTVANFVSVYEAENYFSRLVSVANLSDANLSNSNGQQWTPGDTHDNVLLSWQINTNVVDQMGTYRVYVRCRDNAATCNTKIRVRAALYSSYYGPQFGDYGTYAKYADGTATAGGSNVGGTTDISLVDCGVIQLPPIDTGGVAPNSMFIELHGQAVATGASRKFDIDCIYLIPCFELPYGTGMCVATFGQSYWMGNSAVLDGVIDANDRQPLAYLDNAGVVTYVAQDIRGKPLCVWNNQSMNIIVLVMDSGAMDHRQNMTNTLTITTTPRFRFSRGT